MNLGPFWCERDKSWVRFVYENEIVKAEIAQISSKDPRITTDWQPITRGNWHVSYAYKQQEAVPGFYVLRDGVLYFTDWNPNRVTGINASVLKKSGWFPYNILKDNPFIGHQKEEVSTLLPNTALPLTPEMLLEKLTEERALEEKRIREAQEAERIRVEQEKAQWEACKKGNIRYRGLEAAGRDTLFEIGTLEILYNELSLALYDFHISNYDNCEDYLYALQTIIEEDGDPHHQAIVNMASRTDIDRDLGFTGDEELRKALMAHKKTFFFNLLREEVNYLSNEFHIECNLLSHEEIAEHEEEQRALRNMTFDEMYEQEGSDQELQAALELSRIETERQEQERVHFEQQYQHVLAASLVSNHYPHYDPIEVVEEDQLSLIRNAVTKAQESYKEWYDDKDGVKEIRGRDGFFSRWFFRHGPSGQKRASEFKDDIVRNIHDEENAIERINELLQDSKTAYNRHSFASFLLDELRKIDGSCWSTIAPPKEGIYDKNQVIKRLSVSSGDLGILGRIF